MRRQSQPDYVDQTPVELPVGNSRITLKDEIMLELRDIIQRQKEDEEYELPEEFDDFDIDEDPDPITSKYEVVDMEEEYYEPEPEGLQEGAPSTPLETEPPQASLEPPLEGGDKKKQE